MAGIMTPDKTLEAVAWRWRWEGQSGWNYLDYLPRPDADESEPLYGPAALTTIEEREARIVELEADLDRRAASCCELKVKARTSNEASRLMGKEAAYLHAAELVRQTLTAIKEKADGK